MWQPEEEFDPQVALDAITLATCCLLQEATPSAFRIDSQSSGLASGARSLALVLRPYGDELSAVRALSSRTSGSSSFNPTSLPWANNAGPSASE